MFPILTDIVNITTEVAHQNHQIQNIIAFFHHSPQIIKRCYSTQPHRHGNHKKFAERSAAKPASLLIISRDRSLELSNKKLASTLKKAKKLQLTPSKYWKPNQTVRSPSLSLTIRKQKSKDKKEIRIERTPDKKYKWGKEKQKGAMQKKKQLKL